MREKTTAAEKRSIEVGVNRAGGVIVGSNLGG